MVLDWQAVQEEWIQGKKGLDLTVFGQRANFCYPGFGQIVRKFVSNFYFSNT